MNSKISDFAKTPLIVQDIEKMSTLFRTPAVRKVYKLLEKGDHTADEIKKKTGLRMPTVYSILKQLQDFGACEVADVAEKGKKFKYYSTRDCIIPEGFYKIYDNLSDKDRKVIDRCGAVLTPAIWDCVSHLIENFGGSLPQTNLCRNCKYDHGFFNSIANIVLFSVLNTMLEDKIFDQIEDYIEGKSKT